MASEEGVVEMLKVLIVAGAAVNQATVCVGADGFVSGVFRNCAYGCIVSGLLLCRVKVRLHCTSPVGTATWGLLGCW
jgi:hypothetical protein